MPVRWPLCALQNCIHASDGQLLEKRLEPGGEGDVKHKRKQRYEHRPFERVQDFGHELRGLGGLQTTHIRALKGSTFGAASAGRRLSATERQAIEEQMKRDGKI